MKGSSTTGGRGFRIALAVALVGGFVMGGALSAQAATVYSSWKNFTAGSITYTARSYLTDAAEYGIQVKKSNGTSSAAGYLGAWAIVYRDGTTVCGQAGPTYNGSALVTLSVHSHSYNPGCTADNYNVGGNAYGYNPSTGNYTEIGVYRSPLKAVSP